MLHADSIPTPDDGQANTGSDGATASPFRLERNAMRAFLAAMADIDAGCIEIRVFESKAEKGFIRRTDAYPKTFSGFFDNVQAIETEVGRLDGVSAYITVNPVRRDLLARSANVLAPVKKGLATHDSDVACLRWAYIDIDPIRPAGVSATQAERDKALELQATILSDHPDLKRYALWGCSGNGGWILVRLPDYPNDAAGRSLVSRFIDTLSARYSNGRATVDRATKNPSRVMCLPGTLKCKGSNVPQIGRSWSPVTFAYGEDGR